MVKKELSKKYTKCYACLCFEGVFIEEGKELYEQKESKEPRPLLFKEERCRDKKQEQENTDKSFTVHKLAVTPFLS